MKNYKLIISSKSFENAGKFRSMGELRKQNCMHKEIKADYIQRLLAAIHSTIFSFMFTKNIKMKIYRSTILQLIYVGVQLGL
jgi:hypothetical protein